MSRFFLLNFYLCKVFKTRFQNNKLSIVLLSIGLLLFQIFQTQWNHRPVSEKENTEKIVVYTPVSSNPHVQKENDFKPGSGPFQLGLGQSTFNPNDKIRFSTRTSELKVIKGICFAQIQSYIKLRVLRL